MKESMPYTNAEYVDRGPTKRPPLDHAGPVTVVDAEGHRHTLPAYDKADAQSVVRQGRKNPRALTLAESRLARANKTANLDELRELLEWGKAQGVVSSS